MKIIAQEIPELLLIEFDTFVDHRGFFLERFNKKQFTEHRLASEFVQDNHSRSNFEVLRGLHFQPGQGKLVSVIRGKVWDVAVDIRKNSPTFGKHCGVVLDAETQNAFWIPDGFAHGFCVTDNKGADVIYKVTDFYNPQTENGLLWNDPDLNIPWPIKSPDVSIRDKQLANFKDFSIRDTQGK